MNRRFAVSSLLAGTFSAVTAPAAFGAAEWCEDDPLVIIRTPTGYTLPVHVTNYALGKHQGALQLVHNNPLPPYITYTVDPIAPKGGNSGRKEERREAREERREERQEAREERREERKDDRKDDRNGKKATPTPTPVPTPAPRPAPQSWDVNIWVLIPGHPIPGDAVEGRFMTRTVASTGENATGTILARAAGFSDDLMQLKFTITA
jgi:hypothetical protein